MREVAQRLMSLVSVSVSQVCGLTLLSLQVSRSEAMHAQLAPPGKELDGIGVQLDPAIVDEASEPDPVVWIIVIITPKA
jgi:hypothetical protein